jgi:hypothetical protein
MTAPIRASGGLFTTSLMERCRRLRALALVHTQIGTFSCRNLMAVICPRWTNRTVKRTISS